jgi:hypothetical protein
MARDRPIVFLFRSGHCAVARVSPVCDGAQTPAALPFSVGRAHSQDVPLIVAKKMWHPGHEAKTRDLFDLVLVIERSPDLLSQAPVRHREALIDGLLARRDVAKAQFESIAALEYHPQSTTPSSELRHFFDH